MKLFSYIATAAVIGASFLATAEAGEVNPKIHKLCIEAKDYAGCVRAMKGDTSTTTNIIQRRGADLAEGNQCPAGFTYIGSGNCMGVKCYYDGPSSHGHDPRVAGIPVWKGCKYQFWSGGGVGVMILDGEARASINPECPLGEPQIGYNSTCQTPPAGWESPSAKAAREKREGPKCDFRLKQYDCSYNAYLDANPGMKKWAELNPAMADKERLRLGAVE